jgi:hypothetical protein
MAPRSLSKTPKPAPSQQPARKKSPELDPEGDFDRDGLKNRVEADRGTDPRLADTDGDGLSDRDEVSRKTDPLNVDSDGDGFWDGPEVEVGTSPKVRTSDKAFRQRIDVDSDGLSAAREKELGTDPLNADSDQDGVWDGDEVLLGSRPKDPNSRPKLARGEKDKDGDGLSDELEKSIGTKANKRDSDGDGLDDALEYRHGWDPRLKGEAARGRRWDSDSDGWSDEAELRHGTNAADSNDVPKDFRPNDGPTNKGALRPSQKVLTDDELDARPIKGTSLPPTGLGSNPALSEDFADVSETEVGSTPMIVRVGQVESIDEVAAVASIDAVFALATPAGSLDDLFAGIDTSVPLHTLAAVDSVPTSAPVDIGAPVAPPEPGPNDGEPLGWELPAASAAAPANDFSEVFEPE